jgi:hypothetical protein
MKSFRGACCWSPVDHMRNVVKERETRRIRVVHVHVTSALSRASQRGPKNKKSFLSH